MPLPQKLSASAVKGWAKNKLAQTGKKAVKAAKKKPPGKVKAPADDPEKTRLQEPRPVELDEDDEDDEGLPSDSIVGTPNTEPQDPMNAGGPEVPEEFLEDMLQPEDLDENGDPIEDEEGASAAGGVNPEIEEKLGDFAEVLMHRVSDLEELAAEVEGDLLSEETDLETKREAQALIPDDLRQDLVEHVSALTDEEIMEFCSLLAGAGRIENPELVAGFLRAAVSNSAEGMEDAEDDDELLDGEEVEEGDEEEDSNGLPVDDDEDEDDEDEDDEEGPPAGKAPPFGKRPTGKDEEEEDDDEEDEESTPPKKFAPKKKSKPKPKARYA